MDRYSIFFFGRVENSDGSEIRHLIEPLTSEGDIALSRIRGFEFPRTANRIQHFFVQGSSQGILNNLRSKAVVTTDNPQLLIRLALFCDNKAVVFLECGFFVLKGWRKSYFLLKMSIISVLLRIILIIKPNLEFRIFSNRKKLMFLETWRNHLPSLESLWLQKFSEDDVGRDELGCILFFDQLVDCHPDSDLFGQTWVGECYLNELVQCLRDCEARFGKQVLVCMHPRSEPSREKFFRDSGFLATSDLRPKHFADSISIFHGSAAIEKARFAGASSIGCLILDCMNGTPLVKRYMDYLGVTSVSEKIVLSKGSVFMGKV